MALLRGLALFAGGFGRPGQETAPAWFFHMLHAVNVGALAVAGRWGLAALWLLIWALSAAADWRGEGRG